jgi:hypothetical protein
MNSVRLGPESDCSGNTQKRTLQTRPLVREGAPYEESRNCQTPRHQGRLACSPSVVT